MVIFSFSSFFKSLLSITRRAICFIHLTVCLFKVYIYLPSLSACVCSSLSLSLSLSLSYILSLIFSTILSPIFFSIHFSFSLSSYFLPTFVHQNVGTAKIFDGLIRTKTSRDVRPFSIKIPSTTIFQTSRSSMLDLLNIFSAVLKNNLFQPRQDAHVMSEAIREYQGMLSSVPDMLHVHKGAAQKVKEFTKSDSEKDVSI